MPDATARTSRVARPSSMVRGRKGPEDEDDDEGVRQEAVSPDRGRCGRSYTVRC
jgi:hypothetical protein